MNDHELHIDLLRCEFEQCGQHNKLLHFCSACGRARTRIIIAPLHHHKQDRYAPFRCRECYSQRSREPFCIYCKRGMKFVNQTDNAMIHRRQMEERYVDGLIVDVYTDTDEVVPVAPVARKRGQRYTYEQKKAASEARKNDPTPKRRTIVYERDGGCLRCRKERDLTLHHIRHRSRGGSNEVDNLQTVCRSCHAYIHNVLQLPSGEPYSREREFGQRTQEDEDREWDLIRKARSAKHGKKPRSYIYGKVLATNMAAPEIARLRKQLQQ